MKPNYAYPLDIDWTTAEKVKVTTFYTLVEDAYEHGVDRDNLLAAYRGFKEVVQIKEPSANWIGSLKHCPVIPCILLYRWPAKA